MNTSSPNSPRVKPPLLKELIGSPVAWLATWWMSGKFPIMSGTMGSLAALPFAFIIVRWGGLDALSMAAAAVSLQGILISNAYMTRFDRDDDPKEIVIDEVAGMWIALLPALYHPLSWIAAFLLFRVFDIIKPWPISWADEQLPRGFGVMMDDVLAGLISAALLIILQKQLFFQNLLHAPIILH